MQRKKSAESLPTCASGVRLQAVMDRATSLETMLHTEGKSYSYLNFGPYN